MSINEKRAIRDFSRTALVFNVLIYQALLDTKQENLQAERMRRNRQVSLNESNNEVLHSSPVLSARTGTQNILLLPRPIFLYV